MQRNPTNIFLVTYLPTVLMNIINQAVVYLASDSSQDLIITVNITCMMVLTSVYLSVSSSLPLTPNIKPVEIWLLFNLFYPFFVIITNVVMQVNCNSVILFLILHIFKKTEDTSQTAINRMSEKKSKSNKFNSNFFAKMFAFYVVPVIYTLFTVSYLIYYLILSDY